MADLANIERLETDLWVATDNVRANSKLTAGEYFMPVLRLATVSGCGRIMCRGATDESGVDDGIVFKRRSATRDGRGVRFRGLKPTATIMGSLRDQEAAALAKNIQRTFEALGV
jgi:hypothetical protein